MNLNALKNVAVGLVRALSQAYKFAYKNRGVIRQAYQFIYKNRGVIGKVYKTAYNFGANKKTNLLVRWIVPTVIGLASLVGGGLLVAGGLTTITAAGAAGALVVTSLAVTALSGVIKFKANIPPGTGEDIISSLPAVDDANQSNLASSIKPGFDAKADKNANDNVSNQSHKNNNNFKNTL